MQREVRGVKHGMCQLLNKNRAIDLNHEMSET